MADNCLFSEVEMAIDEAVGYPQAYAKLCRDRQAGLYTHGPPFTFTPYSLKKREVQYKWIFLRKIEQELTEVRF